MSFINTSTVSYGTASGGVTIYLNRRNRLTQVGIIKQSDPDTAPESGQTTTIRIYGGAGQLLRTVTGITGASYTYSAVDEYADAGNLQFQLTFYITAIRDGIESYQTTVHTVFRQ